MIQTLIFSWDGTLHDTRHLYGNALRTVYQGLVEQNLAPEHYYSDDDLAKYIGLPGPVMWESFMPSLPEDIRDQANIQLEKEMAAGLSSYGLLYPGAMLALDELRAAGYYMVILSNCGRPYLDASIDYWDLTQWFEDFYCSEDFDSVSREDIFEKIASLYPGPYVFIGNRDSDLAVAEANQIASIGCSYGFGALEELAAADFIADDVLQISELLQLF